MQAPKTHRYRTRPAFTIIELLVSMALILFIMVILSEAFIQSVAAFSQLKAVGDLQEKMRAAAMIMRRDLQAPHFTAQPADTPPTGTTLSSWDMRTAAPPDGLNGTGFFRIWQGFDAEQDANGNAIADTAEGNDDVQNSALPPTGIPSSRAANHILHFTVQLSANPIRPGDFFSGQIPASDWPFFVNDGTTPPTSILGPAPYMLEYDSSHLYFSPWAEVAYFLRPTGEFAGSTPLYALFRRQKVAFTVADKTTSNFNTSNRRPNTLPANYVDVSCTADPTNAAVLYFNGPDDLTIPQRRMFANQAATSAGLPAGYGTVPNTPWYLSLADAPPSLMAAGDDLLLQDVISFEVKALYDVPASGTSTGLGSDFQLLPVCGSNAALGNNSVYAAAGARVFDTWSSSGTDAAYPGYSTWSTPGTAYSIPLKIRVRALQIVIRVWDKKTQQARQITLVQDM